MFMDSRHMYIVLQLLYIYCNCSIPFLIFYFQWPIHIWIWMTPWSTICFEQFCNLIPKCFNVGQCLSLECSLFQRHCAGAIPRAWNHSVHFSIEEITSEAKQNVVQNTGPGTSTNNLVKKGGYLTLKSIPAAYRFYRSHFLSLFFPSNSFSLFWLRFTLSPLLSSHSSA